MSSIVLLISGLLVHDSGKTWLATSLARIAKERGLRVSMYKPVAGHNAWYQYATVVKSKKLRVLIGSDASIYHEIAPNEPIEKLNPIDLLLAPPALSSYIPSRIDNYLADLENQFKQVVMARISNCFTGKHRHLYIPENLERVPPALRAILKELISEFGAKPIDVGNLIAEIQSEDTEKLLEACLEDLKMNSDLVIVESFNDAIAPSISILKHVDVLLVVTPGHVLVYDSVSSILDALRVEISTRGAEGYRTPYILRHLKAKALLDLEPVASIEEVPETPRRVLEFLLKG